MALLNCAELSGVILWPTLEWDTAASAARSTQLPAPFEGLGEPGQWGNLVGFGSQRRACLLLHLYAF